VDDLKQILNDEENSFSKTLDRGEKLFAETLTKTRDAGSKTIGGSDAWRLYDTFGFPIDLTRLMAAENNMEVNEIEFEACQTKAKELSRGGADKNNEIVFALDVHTISEIENMGIKTTDDSFKYGKEDIPSKIKLLFSEGKFVNTITTSDNERIRFGIILDKTNFYAEQGGQIYDTGSIFTDGKFEFEVKDVQVFGGYVLHIGYLKYGAVDCDDEVTCSYNEV
jgi:alanyl-tRNA synthetase